MKNNDLQEPVLPRIKYGSFQDIKAELQSLTDIIRTRIELERGIGIDAMNVHRTQGESKITSPIPFPSRVEKASTGSMPSLKEVEEQSKAQRLLALKEEVLKCRKCGLCKSRKNVVFGSGNPEVDLMFVGEAPGYEEDVQGEPFVGRAGQLLTKMIEEKRSLNMRRKDVYIANVLKCRPPENRSPRGEEIVLCFPHLAKQIEIIQPKIICALGTFAAQTLLNTKETIGALRGKFYDYPCSEPFTCHSERSEESRLSAQGKLRESKGIKLLATYHPAYLLRNPNDKAKAWDDMKKIRDMLLKIKEEHKDE